MVLRLLRKKDKTTYAVVIMILGFLLCLLILVSVPLMVSAQPSGSDPSQEGIGGIIRCGRSSGSADEQALCDFQDLIEATNNLIRFLVYISVFVAAGSFMYAGYLYVTAAGSDEKVKQAHGIFRNVVIGLLLVLAAWLIVYTISIAVVSDKNQGIILLDTSN